MDETNSYEIENDRAQPFRKRVPRVVAVLAVFSILVAGCHQGHTHEPPSPEQRTANGSNVNFGGWLCLEDWFFSGNSGRYVSSSPDGQGACLPPGITNTLDKPWPSEGVLGQRLVGSLGEEQTIRIFQQHRETFITNDDLDHVASLGIKLVRVPLMWVAFADALSRIDNKVYSGHDPDKDSVIVPDPYYTDLKYVTVPRAFLVDFLQKLSARGLKAVLDLHAFPSGSSFGTYSGVWPYEPAFWSKNARIGDTSIALADVGHWIVDALIHWVEQLDPQARTAVGGITVMNEPAHQMAGRVDPNQILNWVGKAANIFRESHLPTQRIKLYVNLIFTAFKADFNSVVVPWWEKTFSEAERNAWAVMDRHKYLAWLGDSCEGHLPSSPGGAYKCNDPIENITAVLDRCLDPWARDFANHFPGLKACSEFSLGTCQDALSACSNPDVLNAFFSKQMSIMKANNIEPFFWTWRMPFGPNFEAGWSFAKFLGLEKSTGSMCQLKVASTAV